MEEASAQIRAAIWGLKEELWRLKRQGVQRGSIESYRRRGRTYYNHTVYQEGRSFRSYLPLSDKPRVEAAILRGQKVEQVEAAIALLEQALHLLECQ